MYDSFLLPGSKCSKIVAGGTKRRHFISLSE
jgi:hypothetical protein